MVYIWTHCEEEKIQIRSYLKISTSPELFSKFCNSWCLVKNNHVSTMTYEFPSEILACADIRIKTSRALLIRLVWTTSKIHCWWLLQFPRAILVENSTNEEPYFGLTKKLTWNGGRRRHRRLETKNVTYQSHLSCHAYIHKCRFSQMDGKDFCGAIWTIKGLIWPILKLRDQNGPIGKVRGPKRVCCLNLSCCNKMC